MPRRAKIIQFPGARRPPEPAPPGPPADSPEERRLVKVHRCDRAEALVVKGLLESGGIPTLLRSRIAHSVHPFSVGAQGEVAVLVPERDAPRARRLLARIVRNASG